jgi:hypothetical protein
MKIKIDVMKTRIAPIAVHFTSLVLLLLLYCSALHYTYSAVPYCTYPHVHPR